MLIVFPACQAKLLMLSSILQICCGTPHAMPVGIACGRLLGARTTHQSDKEQQ